MIDINAAETQSIEVNDVAHTVRHFNNVNVVGNCAQLIKDVLNGMMGGVVGSAENLDLDKTIAIKLNTMIEGKGQ